MAKLLETTQESLNDCYFSQFFPQPFDSIHDDYLLDFIKNSATHCVFFNESMFLINNSGFLIECNMTCECIGYEGCINFVSVVDQLTDKRREAAIISRNGIILSHTRNFPFILSSHEKFLEERYLHEFIPELLVENLPCGACWQGYKEDSNGEPMHIAAVLKEKKVMNKTFYVIYMTHHEEVIKRWKLKGINSSQMEIIEKKAYPSFREKPESINPDTKVKKTVFVDENTRANVSESEGKNLNKEDKKSSISSTGHPNYSIELQNLRISLRTLSTIKYLLLISVFVT